MRDLSKVFAISSLVFMFALAISPTKDYFREWRSYQNEYNKLLEKQPRRMKPVEVGIKQIWVQDLDRVDRCVSCHLGLKEENLKDVKQPFRTHPRIYHDFDEIGCTICHKGQGLATTFEESLGLTEFWDEPVLPREFLEASCGVCHKETEVTDAPVLTKGRKLIEEYSCVGCHKIGGFTKSFAPSLDGLGDKVSRSWLVRWLKSPREFQPKTRMPDFKLSDEEANALTDFLMTFKSYPNNKVLDPLPEKLKKDQVDEELVELGGTRFREARCISCHLINDRGGYIAPDIGKIASKASAQWIYNYLKTPEELQPGVEMPQYGFNDEEVTAVTAYILSEFVDWDAPDADTANYTPLPGFFERGLKLFNKYNCGGCHEFSGIKKSENMGPDLTFVGSKRKYELEFGNADVERNLPSYLYSKTKDPRQFIETARMPQFSFDENELFAITTALLSMTEDQFPDKYRVPKEFESSYDPQGKFGKLIRKYSCFSCHVINKSGFLLATDLTNEGSRVQRDWLEDYFRLPYTIRPILTERMPNLFMSEDEINIVVDYVYLALVNDEISDVKLPIDNPSFIAEGEKLFFDRYGCRSCHQVSGIGGYVGPPLDHTGSRLTAGWVYSWIRNPQKYRPDTIDPNAGLADDEAIAITAYLMSLK